MIGQRLLHYEIVEKPGTVYDISYDARHDFIVLDDMT